MVMPIGIGPSVTLSWSKCDLRGSSYFDKLSMTQGLPQSLLA